MFEETYELTKRALRQGLETPIDKDDLLSERREQSLELLQATPEQRARIESLWQQFGDDYLLSCRPEEIAWHARLLALDSDMADAPSSTYRSRHRLPAPAC